MINAGAATPIIQTNSKTTATRRSLAPVVLVLNQLVARSVALLTPVTAAAVAEGAGAGVTYCTTGGGGGMAATVAAAVAAAMVDALATRSLDCRNR